MTIKRTTPSEKFDDSCDNIMNVFWQTVLLISTRMCTVCPLSFCGHSFFTWANSNCIFPQRAQINTFNRRSVK